MVQVKKKEEKEKKYDKNLRFIKMHGTTIKIIRIK